MAPSISSDGLTLYFHSDRPGGTGLFNIWATERNSTTDAWGTPYAVSGFIGSLESARAPEIPADGQSLFFASDRVGGTGSSRDIWMVSAVPVPAAVWLFGSGLLALVGLARKRPV